VSWAGYCSIRFFGLSIQSKFITNMWLGIQIQIYKWIDNAIQIHSQSNYFWQNILGNKYYTVKFNDKNIECPIYMFGNIWLGYFDLNLKAWSRNNRSCCPRISQATLTCAAQTASPLLSGLLEQAKVISRCPNTHLQFILFQYVNPFTGIPFLNLLFCSSISHIFYSFIPTFGFLFQTYLRFK